MNLLARLDRLPLSSPHYLLLLLGGLGYTFDGMDAAVVSFLMPSTQALWHLTDGQLGMLGSASAVGYLLAAGFTGVLADRVGRRRVMMYALVCYAFFSVVAALAPDFGTFLGARVLAGAGAGAESVVIAPFLSEFVPPARRGWFVGTLAGFFSFGFVGAAFLGRFVVVQPDGWRWAQVITAAPILLLLWWRRTLPESPRFLLAAGREAEAERVVADLERRVEASTGRPLPPVPEQAAVAPAAEQPPLGPGAALRHLWSRPMARRTATTWLIWFVITFAYYGFFSWIPTLLVQQGITVTRSFSFSIVIYLAQIPGYFSAAWLCERIDRKNTIAVYLAGSAAAAYWLSQTHTPTAITLAGAVLSFFLNGTYAGVYSYTPEVFPTFIRATGTGYASGFGRIGSITAPLIIGALATSLGFAGVFGLTTAVLAAGVVGTLVFALPTANRSLEALAGRPPAGADRTDRPTDQGALHP
ncbi:MFS transporter [Streptomyces sp. NPDC059740]|uniref:MFS transporter n=1 Tax=Streptomyces sp. NPDC059740 TaxID=3346926 RepID=UPI003647D303